MSGKAETIRRLRLGDLLRVLRHRHGPILSDDDAGRDDLNLVLRLHSLCPERATDKMWHVVETLAPWMLSAEASDQIDSLMRVDPRYNQLGAKELGERLNLSNAEREFRKAWLIAPVDMTAGELAEQRKAKERARKAAKRRQAGVKSRPAYLAAIKSTKPWEAEGMSRASWYRHRETRCVRNNTCSSSGHTLSHTPKVKRRRAFKWKLSPPRNCKGNVSQALNVVDGCIPSDLGVGTSAEVEEERRLLYVAMTRAKDQLHLVVPQCFFTHGQHCLILEA
jgi:hypothetical protein